MLKTRKLAMSRHYRSAKRGLSRKGRRSSSWKGLSQQFKLKRFFQRLKLAVLLVLGVSLVWGTLYLWKFFTQPFASAASSFQNNESWDGKTPLNLMYLVVSDVSELAPTTHGVGLLTFNPTQGSFSAITVPSTYPSLHNLYALGRLSEDRDGLRRVRDELADLMGVAINGYVLVGEAGLAKAGSLFPADGDVKDYITFANLRYLPTVWEIGRQNLLTDLGVGDILRIFWYIISLRSDNTNVLSLSPEVLQDQVLLDHKITPFLQDEQMVGEHLKIQILNGSGVPGVAAQAARIIKNLGGEVIRVDNYERRDLVKGFLVTDSSGTYTAAQLSKIFNLADSRPPRSGSEARANTTVILGLDNSY